MQVAGARTVLIIDDDSYARMAVESLLARDPRTRVYGSAASPEAALSMIRESGRLPDVVLLDLNFGDDIHAGLGAIPSLRKEAPKTAILMMSVSTDTALARAALQGGADGFVSKNESAEAIADAVDQVASGHCVVTDTVGREILEGLHEVEQYIIECLPSDRRLLEITGQTHRTVYLYCLCGLSAKETAEELCVSVHTVNTRIRDAYRMLGATNRADAFRVLTSNADH